MLASIYWRCELILRHFHYCQLKCSEIRTLLDLKIIFIYLQCCLSGQTSPISVSIATKNSVFVQAAFLNIESPKENIQTISKFGILEFSKNRRSRSQIFFKIGDLKISKFHSKTPVLESLFKKVAG